MKKTKTPPPIDPLDVMDPARWGLCLAAILDLGLRLYRFWERYRSLFASRTRDTSAQAYLYLRAVLTMERERNFKNIARRLEQGEDGQALQHFMSTSPWDKCAIFRQIQADLSAISALRQGSVLILDESAGPRVGTPVGGGIVGAGKRPPRRSAGKTVGPPIPAYSREPYPVPYLGI